MDAMSEEKIIWTPLLFRLSAWAVAVAEGEVGVGMFDVSHSSLPIPF